MCLIRSYLAQKQSNQREHGKTNPQTNGQITYGSADGRANSSAQRNHYPCIDRPPVLRPS